MGSFRLGKERLKFLKIGPTMSVSIRLFQLGPRDSARFFKTFCFLAARGEEERDVCVSMNEKRAPNEEKKVGKLRALKIH